MCGIVGFAATGSPRSAEPRSLLDRMSEALNHRGPDDAGAWVEASGRVGFGFRRLAVVDLTDAGHQPMRSPSGRYQLVFNGEIYNFTDLRVELESDGDRFVGHSDTEVLLHAIERWGVHDALVRANGMFALALWDADERRLILARDRFGEKPLYYGMQGGSFLFASELKAIARHPDFGGRVDRDALTAYFRFGYVPGPRSIFAGLAKLEPGSWLGFDLDRGQVVERRLFWSPVDAMAAATRAKPVALDASASPDAVANLDAVLRRAVGQRMIADVPLGGLLSGGVDSSTVVALMQDLSTSPVRTFTIGFDEPEYDESRWAARVAAHLGTDHTELVVRPREALDVIPGLPAIYDEPFADSSQIPTILVSRLARQHVTVALTGDGADELFGGYQRYFPYAALHRRVSRLPRRVRRFAGRALAVVPGAALGRVGRLAGTAGLDHKVGRLAEVLAHSETDLAGELYREFVSQWHDPQRLVIGGREDPGCFGDGSTPALVSDPVRAAMLLDTRTYLPDDILVKVDRAAMSTSLETRTPYLDPAVYDAAWSIPGGWLVRAGAGKAILRDVLHRYLPADLVDRPKMGFGVPIAQWLRGELRSWAESLLDPSLLRDQGFLNADAVRRVWHAHLAGEPDREHEIWAVLMWQAWLAEWRVTGSPGRCQSQSVAEPQRLTS